jgi:hypothetical protein
LNQPAELQQQPWRHNKVHLQSLLSLQPGVADRLNLTLLKRGWAAFNAHASRLMVSTLLKSAAVATPNMLSCVSCMQGTATIGKGLMSRNDQFTKLMGDVNKQQHLL